MVDFDALFATAPKAVVDYFDRRPSVPTWRWTDMAPREHALAFTAARTAGFDVIDDLRDALRKAVVDRVPFDQFRQELTPLLQQKGWWGQKIAPRPDGFKAKVQLGSPRRLQIMYWANVASAEAAGEWQRIQETKDFLPNLRYATSISEHKRPEHLALVGTTLPADDSWWRTHFPPNGWYCKCRVEQLAAHEAEVTPRPKGSMRSWTNKHTGDVQEVPEGIDPGWQSNPGTDRERRLSKGLTEAIERLPPKPRAEAVARIARSPLLDHVAKAKGDPDFRIPIATLPPEAEKFTGASTNVVKLSGASARHILDDHPDITAEDIGAMAEGLQNGIVRGGRDPGFMRTYFLHAGRMFRATVKATRKGDEIFVTTLHPASARQLRVDGIAVEGILKEGETPGGSGYDPSQP